MIQILKSLFVVLVLLFTAACQTVPQGKNKSSNQGAASTPSGLSKPWFTSEQYFSDRFAVVSTLDAWSLRAKVGIVLPKRREQASLLWRFSDAGNQVRLFGPLGIGAVTLDFDQKGAQLTDSKGQIHKGLSAQALLTRIVGWPMPMEALVYWIFALPQPNGDYAYQLDDAGALGELKQFGWQISYSNYSNQAGIPMLNLARKVTATKTAPNGQKIVVKLIAKSWQR